MPGDEMIRQEHENDAGLIEEREEYDVFSLPEGRVKRVPTGELRVERGVDGRLVKRRGTHRNPFFDGCGCSRLAAEQEAQLVHEGAQRAGFCLKCGSEWCGACRSAACKRCSTVHDACEDCQTPACRKCLTTLPARLSGQPCLARCAKCVEAAKAPPKPVPDKKADAPPPLLPAGIRSTPRPEPEPASKADSKLAAKAMASAETPTAAQEVPLCERKTFPNFLLVTGGLLLFFILTMLGSAYLKDTHPHLEAVRTFINNVAIFDILILGLFIPLYLASTD